MRLTVLRTEHESCITKQESFAPSLVTLNPPHSKGVKDSCENTLTPARMSPAAPENSGNSKTNSGLNDSCFKGVKDSCENTLTPACMSPAAPENSGNSKTNSGLNNSYFKGV